MQKKKNIILIILLIIMIAITAGVVYIFENEGVANKQEKLFATNQIQEVETVEIDFKGEKNTLRLKNGTWTVNNKYNVDDDLSAVLIAVLKEVKYIREVPKSEKDSIVQFLQQNGASVKIFATGNQLIKSFIAGGNEQRNVTYIWLPETEKVYKAGIPGYNSYVAGIFELNETNWREKDVFSSNWSSIRSINVDYPDFPDKSFNILSKTGNITMQGVNYLDTIKLSDYLDIFNSFKADLYLEKDENADYDKIINQKPAVIIALEDVDPEKNNLIKIYPGTEQDKYWPVLLSNNQVALFHKSKIKSLLLQKSDFEKK